MGEFDDLIPVAASREAGAFDDLIPHPAGEFADLIPKNKKRSRDSHDAQLSAAPEDSAWTKGKRAFRESLSPLIGPTSEEQLRESVVTPAGEVAYKPLAGDVDREGFTGALSHPFVPLEELKSPVDPTDSKAMAITKAVGNTALGFAEFIESPLGVATAGAGSIAGMTAKELAAIRAGKAAAITEEAAAAANAVINTQRAVAGGFAADMASKVPELASHAGDVSVNGSPQEKAEAFLQLGVNAFLVPGLALHAKSGKTSNIEQRTSNIEPPKVFSEFGGERVENTFADLIPAESKWSTGIPVDVGTKTEVHTFGETFPVEKTIAESTFLPRETTIIRDQVKYPVVEIPLQELKLSEDVPNFKADADADTGVVAGQKLEGNYERLGTGAITVYERTGGQKEVISGRHRFDLAKRAGEETIPSQIVREADGFTPQDAMTLDAEMNIRDGQGSVGDYANYFRNAEITPEEAAQRGLTARAKGKAGWDIGRNASDDVYSLYRAGKINEAQTAAIARSAPLAIGDRQSAISLQRVGVKAALDGKSAQEISNFIQAVKLETKSLPPEQFDLFAADDSALKEAERLASVASRIQTELSREIRATEAAAKNATTAKAKGLTFDRPPEEILQENAILKEERDRWDNWALHKEMVDQVRGYAEMDRAQKGERNFSLDEKSDESKLPSNEPRYTEPQIDEAIERLKSALAEDFKSGPMAERIKGLRRAAPDLRDPDTGKAFGLNEKVRQAFEKTFGVKIVPVYNPSGRFFGGVRDSRFPGLLFIDVRSEQPALVVAGHELLHDLRGRSPNLYRGLESRLVEFIQDFPSYQERLNERYRKAGIDNLTEEKAREELIADFFGEQMGSETFWRKLQAKDAPFFERLATVTLDFLRRVKDRFVDFVSQTGSKVSDQYFRDVDKAQDVVASALTAYSRGMRDSSGPEGLKSLSFSLDAEKLRQFGEKVRASEDISPEVTGLVSEYNYFPRSNETDLATAKRIVTDRGLDIAIETFKNPPRSMPGAVQSALGKHLILEMALQEKLARVSKDTIKADELVGKQVDLIDHELQRSTDVAQSLQAMRLFGDMSPSAVLRHAKRTIERAGQTVLETVKPTIDAIKNELRQANAEAVEAVKQDPTVNIAAREAVDAAIAESAETHRGIVMELAEPFATSPFILQHAKDAVRAKVNELLNTAPRPPGMNVSQHHRILLNQLAAHAVSIANGHYQGAEPGVVLKDKLRTRLGITDAYAGRLAKQLDAQFAKLVETAKKKLSAKIVNQRAKRELKMTPQDHISQSRSVWSREKQAASESLVKALKPSTAGPKTALQEFSSRLTQRLREQLIGKAKPEAKAKLSDIEVLREAMDHSEKYQEVWDQALTDIQKAFPDSDVLHGVDTIARLFSDSQVDRIIQKQLREMNLKLGDVVTKHANEVDATGTSIGKRVVQASGLTGEKADRLSAVFDSRFKAVATAAKRQKLEQLQRRGVKVPKPLRQAFEKLIDLSNLGAFDDAKFFDTAAREMKIPTVTPEMAKEITRRANDLQSKPEGFQKQKAILELMDYIGRTRGLAWHELPMAFWYANILSGPITHVVNTAANALNISANVALQIGRNPLDAPQVLSAFARGFGKGGLEAIEIMKSGFVTGTKLTKFEESRPLELTRLPGKLDYILTPWRAVTRALAAEDMLFYKAAEEMKGYAAARQIARREGLSGKAQAQRVANILGNLESRVTAARAQANAEGLSGLDFRRRVNEILEQARPEELRNNARDYALKVTFNEKPYGLLGKIAAGFNYINREAVVTRFAVPFTNIISNVANESLNYFPPVGGARALWGHWKGRLDGKPITDRVALQDQWAKVALGTVMLGALAWASSSDDDDPQFAVYGKGPNEKSKRDQMKAAGWIPYSFKVGNRYIKYQNSPAAIPIAIMGNYFDAVRFKNLDNTSAGNRAAYAMGLFGSVMLESSFLDGLSRIMDMVKSESVKKAGVMFTESATRTASSFVIPNALKQIDRIFDPGVYESTDVESALMNQVPFVRCENRPTLNVFGEPVQAYVSDRFTSTTKPDELLRALASKKIWISVPQRDDVVIGRKSAGEDNYRILTPDEFYDYVKTSGQAIRANLTPRLADIRKMEPAQAKAYVQAIVEFERKKAKLKFSL